MDQYVEALERRVSELEKMVGRVANPPHSTVPKLTAAMVQDQERRLAGLEKAVLTLADAVEKLVDKSPVPAKKK